MSFKELVLKNRSYRRFFEDKKIEKNELVNLVDIARNTASGANNQPLRYKVVCDEESNKKVFDTLKWAGALPDWDGPVEGERPAGYIIICSASSVPAPRDEVNLGGCMFASVNIPKLNEELSIPEGMTARLVIALGYPKEQVVIDEVSEGANLKYYRDDNQVHHVPKLKLENVLL